MKIPNGKKTVYNFCMENYSYLTVFFGKFDREKGENAWRNELAKNGEEQSK